MGEEVEGEDYCAKCVCTVPAEKAGAGKMELGSIAGYISLGMVNENAIETPETIVRTEPVE